MAVRERIELRPQPGPQTIFHATPADIAIYGGGAGGGKTWSLLFEPLRHLYVPGFPAVIFRRTAPMITRPGGLWDESQLMYPQLGLKDRTSPSYDWRLPTRKGNGWHLVMSHMEHEKHRLAWQGAQVAYEGWDELTHFTELQFWYMISRLRSGSGVPGYSRGTCNPDPDSWVRQLVDWWIDEEGYAIPERSGVVRYFARDRGEMVWADRREELLGDGGFDPSDVMSFTFVPATVYDNKVLLEKDPSYLSKLKALPLVEREQLLGGNWNIRPAAGNFFQESWFPVDDAAPAEATRIRYWDRAGTSEIEAQEKKTKPDWTVGLLLSRDKRGRYFVEHVERFQESPAGVEERIKNTALRDGKDVQVGIEQDPGQAGKAEAQYYVRRLAGFNVRCYPVQKRGNKTARAKPVSAQAEVGNVHVVRGPWNRFFFQELTNFPSKNSHDDQVDALSGAFYALTEGDDWADPFVMIV